MILSLIDQSFNKELIEKLTEALNSTDKNITIYLKSSGGSVSVMECVLDIVNTNKDRIELVGFGSLESAAFLFFFLAECKKRILPNTIGHTHQQRLNIDVNEKLKPYYLADEAEMERGKSIKKDLDIFNKQIGLNKKELAKYKRGEDAYFQYDRFLELIDNYDKNKAI